MKSKLTFYTANGSSSSNIIGKFLIENKEFFSSNFKLEINRLNSVDAISFNSSNPNRKLPVLIFNESVISGTDNIMEILADLMMPIDKEDNYSENLAKKFFENPGVDDEVDDSEKFDREMSKKRDEFSKKQKKLGKKIEMSIDQKEEIEEPLENTKGSEMDNVILKYFNSQK